MVRIALRPTIAAFAVFDVTLSLCGGLLVYYSSLDAVSTLVDQSHTLLGRAVQQSRANLNSTMSQAMQTLWNTVDESSNADVHSFRDKINKTFDSVVMHASILMETVEMQSMHWTGGLDDWGRLVYKQACAQTRSAQLIDSERMTGAGFLTYENDAAIRNTSLARHMSAYCWLDMCAPEPCKREWYGHTDATWSASNASDGNTSTDGEWVVSYRYIPDINLTYLFPDQSLDYIVDTSRIEDSWGQTAEEVQGRVGERGRWSEPKTWYAETGYVLLYITYSICFEIKVGPLAGTVALARAETDLGHWSKVVHDYIANTKPVGAFVIVDPNYGLTPRHTREPEPDMGSIPSCINGERVTTNGLGEAESSACFPRLEHYSEVTQFIAGQLNTSGVGYDELLLRERRGVSYFMRKSHLLRVGAGFSFDVLWYRDAAEVEHELEEREREASEATNANEALLRMEAERMERSAEDNIRDGLWRMVACVLVAFVFNVVVGVGWVALLANPLRHTLRSVLMMGDMRIDDALVYHGDHSGRARCQVSEVRDLGDGFIVAARLLRQYASFLPSTTVDTESRLCAEIEAPQGVVALVFTDIKSSTLLWETATHGMGEALDEHNKIMRRMCIKYSGYEVKTIGDAFFIVFQSPTNALLFCLGVQEELVQAPIPEQFHELDLTKPVWGQNGKAIWGGLRVRIGCHYGEVTSEVNPHTKRYDYRGPAVNKASRFESNGIPGVVTISEECHSAIKGNLGQLYDGNAIVRFVGKKEMKGIPEPQRMHAVLPPSLSERPTEEAKKGQSPKQIMSGLSAARTTSGLSVPPGGVPNAAPWRTPLVKPRQSHVTFGGTAQRRATEVGSRMSEEDAGNERGMKLKDVVRELRTKALGKLDLGLATHQATVCAVDSTISRSPHADVQHLGYEYNMLVATCAEMARRCTGVVLSVSGVVTHASWNLSGPGTAQHVLQGLRFTHMTGERVRGIATLGASTGRMLFGNIGSALGSDERRYPIATGLAFYVSAQLAQHAPSIAAQSLAACAEAQLRPHSGGPVEAFAKYCRVIDVWGAGSGATVRVFEPRYDALHDFDDDDLWGMNSDRDVEITVSKHDGMVLGAIGGDAAAVTQLEKMLADGESGPVRDKVMAHMVPLLRDHLSSDYAGCGYRILVPGIPRERRSGSMISRQSTKMVMVDDDDETTQHSTARTAELPLPANGGQPKQARSSAAAQEIGKESVAELLPGSSPTPARDRRKSEDGRRGSRSPDGDGRRGSRSPDGDGRRGSDTRRRSDARRRSRSRDSNTPTGNPLCKPGDLGLSRES